MQQPEDWEEKLNNLVYAVVESTDENCRSWLIDNGATGLFVDIENVNRRKKVAKCSQEVKDFISNLITQKQQEARDLERAEWIKWVKTIQSDVRSRGNEIEIAFYETMRAFDRKLESNLEGDK